jgi:hypothetical protein
MLSVKLSFCLAALLLLSCLQVLQRARPCQQQMSLCCQPFWAGCSLKQQASSLQPAYKGAPAGSALTPISSRRTGKGVVLTSTASTWVVAGCGRLLLCKFIWSALQHAACTCEPATAAFGAADVWCCYCMSMVGGMDYPGGVPNGGNLIRVAGHKRSSSQRQAPHAGPCCMLFAS